MASRKPDARITAASLVTLGIAFLMVAAIGGRGWNEESLRFLVRITARISVILFLIAFAWDDAVAIVLSRPIRRPAPNRVHFFVGFAVSHLIHLGTLVALALLFPTPFVDDLEVLTLVGGGLAYGFIFGIAICYCVRGDPFPEPALVSFGLLYIWVVFTRAYAFRAAEGVTYALLFAVLVLTILVEGIVFVRRRRQREAGGKPSVEESGGF